MPELPEVETVRRILENDVLDKEISSIDVFRDKNILTGASSFVEALVGTSFTKIGRKGKFLIFFLANGYSFISHLRMEGKWRLSVPSERQKHDILAINFKNGETLFYNDVRKFGVIILKKDDLWTTPPLSEVGDEPFSMDEEKFLNGLHKKGLLPIKEALLDQTLVAGIGNIYDVETLYASHIHPLTPCCEIKAEESHKILAESSRIMNEAISCGGSTIKSFHPKEGYSGLMQNKLLIYGKNNEPCPICGTPIRKIEIGGRGTSYCPRCQPRHNGVVTIGVTGAIGSGKSALSKLLEKRGYELFDADKEVALLYKDPSFISSLPAKFRKYFSKDALIDKDGLRTLISESAETKDELNAIVHPLIYKKAIGRIGSTKKKAVVFDVPILLDSPLERECDYLFYVQTDEETRMKRLAKRDTPTEEMTKINADFPERKAKHKATHTFDGNHGVDHLADEVNELGYLP